MKLEHAKIVAGRIVGALAQWCERIDIAGSIRRGRPHVGDIDIVLMAKPGAEASIRARLLQSCRKIVEGPQAMVVGMKVPAGMPHPLGELQVDVWFAHHVESELFGGPACSHNYGTMLVCRTGSREHNIGLAMRARELGLKWDPHHGVKRGDRVIAAEEESHVFEALHMTTPSPEDREGMRIMKPIAQVEP